MLERLSNSSARTQAAIVVAVLALVSLILAAIWFFVFRVEYRTIFTHLHAGDAAAIVGELEKQKVPYHLGDAGTTIAVPEGEADAVRLSLAGSDAALKGKVGFELFDKSDMGITDFAQKINYQRALQGELERTIATLDGVENARVHLSMGDDRLFRQDRAPPKASVTVRMRDGATVPQDTVAGVQQLVSAAVPLLDASAVVVLDEAGRVMGSAGPFAADSSLPPQVAEKHAIEQYFQARVRAALDGLFGPNYIAVSVAAEIPVSGEAPLLDPRRRTFGVQVKLQPRNELAAKAREGALSIVAASIGLNSALGDTIAFEAPGSPSAEAVSAPGAAPRPMQAAAPPSSGLAKGDYLAAGVAGLGLLGLAFMVGLLARRRPASLDDEARLGFADRLKLLLDEDGDSGPAQA